MSGTAEQIKSITKIMVVQPNFVITISSYDLNVPSTNNDKNNAGVLNPAVMYIILVAFSLLVAL